MLGIAACAQPDNEPPVFEPDGGTGGVKEAGPDATEAASNEGGASGEGGEGGASTGGSGGKGGSAGKGGSGTGGQGWGGSGAGGADAGVECGSLTCGSMKCQTNTTPPVDITMEGCCKEPDVCGFIVMSVNCKTADEVAGLGFTCEPKP